MAKRSMTLLAAAALTAAALGTARARPARARFATDKTFGLGLMIGTPAGLSGKYYLTGGKPIALDFGVGYLYDYHHGEGLHLHMDVLWHPVVLATAESFVLPFYLGVGGRIYQHDDYYDNRGRYYDRHSHAGIRFPFGIAFDFNNVPLDAFFELALVFDFFFDEQYEHDHLDINGSIGVRYYF